MTDETLYNLLKHIAQNSRITQRELADIIGASLGKVNYCLRHLIDRGWVEVRPLPDAGQKPVSHYLLTADGIDHKATLIERIVRRKKQEYEGLQKDMAAARNQFPSQDA